MGTNKTTNSVACSDQQIGNSSNTLVQTKFAPPSSLQPLLESMVTNDSLHDTDSTSTDDFIDYDPNETFEDVKANHDIQYPCTSRSNLSQKSFPLFKRKNKPRKHKKKS
ncbi:hypothetical protein AVEN_6619-1 [Araneus ventricosus]|uniref:Uncharacterized protein n=1 Tax=Araneus ventricosus TaxID=182803 RepID=A0A4Y2NXU9_ARAVE|nr:hypothetical protein AVEN_6619-1 [Araneus ventricosus]